MRRLMTFLGIAAVVTAVCLVPVACNKGGDTSTSPSVVSEAPATSGSNASVPAPPASGTGQTVTGSGICEGKETVSSRDKTLTFCVLDTNLDLLDNRCQVVTASKKYTVTWGIISASDGWLRSGAFHAPENSCGSAGSGNGADQNDHLTFKASTVGVKLTTQWDVSVNSCGMDQHDGLFKNATDEVRWPFGVVFNYPEPCVTCETINGSLTYTQDGTTITVTPKFNHKVGDTKINGVLDWGDNTTSSATNGVPVSHTYPAEPQQKFTIKLKLTGGGVECDPSITVTVGTNPTCKDYTPPTITGDLGVTPGPSSYTFDAGTVAPTGGTWSTALPATVNRPNFGQPDASFSDTYTKSYGPDNLKCTVSKPFTKTVPAKDPTCGDVNPQLSTYTVGADSVHAKSVRASIASTYNVGLHGSWVNPGTGSLAYGDGASDNENNPFNVTHGYAQTDSQQTLTATLTVVRGSLTCPVTTPVVIPPRTKTCADYTPTPPDFRGDLDLTDKTATTEKVTSGTVRPSGGTWSDPLPKVVNRPAYGSTFTFSDVYTEVVSYGPSELQCTKSYDHTYSIAIPPQDCPKVNTWTLKNNRSDQVTYAIVVATNKDDPADSIIPNGTFNLGPGASATFTGFNSQTLYAFYKLPQTGPTQYVYYMHDSSSHARDACTADGGTWQDGPNHECDTPHRHGNSNNNYKWSNYYGSDDATYQSSIPGVTTYEYDFTDSATSTACGVQAAWLHDASLTVSCACSAR
ncbi:MAG TPA: hypothetical protein VMU12_00590 [Candidatus Paceibacterota bacterium]|nr:hypothetical protein [Candidatus Paceibacterota bacterium]